MNRITPMLGLIVLLCIGLASAGGGGGADPYPLTGYVFYPDGTVAAAVHINITNQNTGETICADSNTAGYYTQDAANFPSEYTIGDELEYYSVIDNLWNRTNHTLFARIGVGETWDGKLNITLSRGWWVPRETTTTPQESINESAYGQLEDAMQAANPSWTDFTDAIAKPYLNVMGSIFFLFLFGVPMLMIYIRHDSINVPATFVFMFGAFIVVLLPPQWQLIGKGLLALALFGAVYSFMKERERG